MEDIEKQKAAKAILMQRALHDAAQEAVKLAKIIADNRAREIPMQLVKTGAACMNALLRINEIPL